MFDPKARPTTLDSTGCPAWFPARTASPPRSQALRSSKADSRCWSDRAQVIDPVLQPAGTATSVDVVVVPTLVTTDSPTVGSVMERTQIEQLPINGRSLITLMQQIPGMEGQRADGSRHASLEFVLDCSQEIERRWATLYRSASKRFRSFEWT